jgi:hypothetical protein
MSGRRITPVPDSETTAGPMTGPEHFRKAEELAARAAEHPGQADGQDSAAVWAAVAQVHATLALAATSREPATSGGARPRSGRSMGRAGARAENMPRHERRNQAPTPGRSRVSPWAVNGHLTPKQGEPSLLLPDRGRPDHRAPGQSHALGMARQLGWIPPTPAYLFRMARAKRRAKRL